jgi:hypothetical protein
MFLLPHAWVEFSCASACSSQYVIPISRYIVVAVVRCSCACSRLPVRPLLERAIEICDGVHTDGQKLNIEFHSGRLGALKDRPVCGCGGRVEDAEPRRARHGCFLVVRNHRVLRSLVWSAWVSGLNSRAYFGSAGAEPQAS